jgi:hypothetical protein
LKTILELSLARQIDAHKCASAAIFMVNVVGIGCANPIELRGKAFMENLPRPTAPKQ